MTNPYRPPTAPVTGPEAPAVVTVGRLIRWYQGMVVAATVLGLVQWSSLLHILAPLETLSLLGVNGAGAVVSQEVVDNAVIANQLLWIASAIGLCFFTWWARPLFIASYVLSAVIGLVAGVQLALPLDSFVVLVATLLDGAILALSFLPPLSGYFARERKI